MTVMILNYGKTLPKDDKGMLGLYYGMNNDQNATADHNWRIAIYVSQYTFQQPDFILDPLVRFSTFDNTIEQLFCMPPSDPSMNINPAFWSNIVAWLRPGGIFISIPEDDHIIDSYLVKLNRYDIFFKLKNTPYQFMSDEFKSTINYCYYLCKTDIVRLCMSKLIAEDGAAFVTDSLLARKALVFRKANVSENTG